MAMWAAVEFGLRGRLGRIKASNWYMRHFANTGPSSDAVVPPSREDERELAWGGRGPNGRKDAHNDLEKNQSASE